MSDRLLEIAIVANVFRFGVVGALLFDPVQILFADIASDVLARETGSIEVLDSGIVIPYRGNQVGQILVDQPVRTDGYGNLMFTAPIGDQFRSGRHIDAINIGKPHRGAADAK